MSDLLLEVVEWKVHLVVVMVVFICLVFMLVVAGVGR